MALVCAVIAASISVGSILKSSATSTNTGFAPVAATTQADAMKELLAVITSSPGPISKANKAKISASVPELQPVAYFVLQKFENVFSKLDTSAPFIKICEEQTSFIFSTTSD